MASALSGVGSKIDVNTLVSQMMAVEARPLDALTQKVSEVQSDISAYGRVRSALATLQSAARTMGDPATAKAATVSSSDASVLASASAGATPATHLVEVTRLAQAHRVYSPAFAATSSPAGSGTLNISIGGAAAEAVTIPAGATLADVRDAINTKGLAVRASLVNDGSGQRLVLASTTSGAGSAIAITPDNDSLAAFAFPPASAQSGGMTEAVRAQDAAFSIDGLPMTRASNVIADAIDGLSVTLARAGSATLSVSTDSGAIRSAADAFVKAYVDSASLMKTMTAYDIASGKGGALANDATVRGIAQRLRSALGTSLTSLGIGFQKDGTLSMDSAKFNTALAASPADVATALGTASTALKDALSKVLDTDGTIDTRTNGLQSNIKRMNDQQTRMQARLSALETRYRSQFSTLDGLLSRADSQSSWLTSQFKALSNSNNGN